MLSLILSFTCNVGDGGNELGMGKVLEQVCKHIPRGDVIASAFPATHVIAAGTSDWGGYGLARALSVLAELDNWACSTSDHVEQRCDCEY